MNEPLVKRTCVPCEGNTKPLEQKFIDEYLEEVPLWIQTGDSIRREFTFKDFKGALQCVNKIAVIAEAENHHPDIMLSWGKVVVTLSTHAIGGLSENDFIVASKIDTLVF